MRTRTFAVSGSAAALLSALAVAVSVAASTPTVTTGSAGSVTASTATVSGMVNPNGTPTSYAFQYGPSTSYGRQTSSQSAGSGTSAENVTATLNGLPSGKTIHYRIIATYGSTSTVVGNDATFNTSGSPPVVNAPDATTGSATNVTTNGAQLNGTVGPSSSDATYYFQYGLDTSYGMQSNEASLSASGSSRPVNATLSGLQSNVTYHYRLITRSSSGLLSVGADGTFATRTHGRVRPRGLSIGASSTLGRGQVTVRASGTLRLPAGVSAQSACFGTVWVTIKAGTRTLAHTPRPLSRSCHYRESQRFSYGRLHHSRRLHIIARFGGNGTLLPIWSRWASARA